MASGLESRAPFMDYRVVQYVFSLPLTDIVGGGETKHILRQAVRDILPDSVVQRRAKLGFTADLKQWFHSPPVAEYLSAIIHDPGFNAHGWIDQPAFTRRFERCVKQGFRRQDTVRIWEVVNLSLWWQIFVKNKPPLSDAFSKSARE
jgi:asparagine synthase (glutamine-hydrolysing)